MDGEKSKAHYQQFAASPLHVAVRDFRTSRCYQAILRAAKYYVLPFLSAVLLVYVGAVVINHLAFNIIDPTGILCHGTAPADCDRLTEENLKSKKPIEFSTNSICFATGVYLTSGAKYAVTIAADTPWRAGDLPETSPMGFRSAEAPFWNRPLVLLAMPFRRVYFRRWFAVIARIGAVGMNEDYVDESPDPPKQNEIYSGVTKPAGDNGELFLYVNDAVVALPGLYDVFYQRNHGTAHIRVERLVK